MNAEARWTEADLRTIGYFPCRPPARPDWLHAEQVELLCIASGCCGGWPAEPIAREHQNLVGLYDTIARARSIVPAHLDGDYLCTALSSLPAKFDGARALPWELSMRPDPVPASFVRLGFDVVQCSSSDLECSPLACNHMANRYRANRWCLFDTLAMALDAARRFVDEPVEPGPYVVVEVRVERMPSIVRTGGGPD